jgi:hypothetical protein
MDCEDGLSYTYTHEKATVLPCGIPHGQHNALGLVFRRHYHSDPGASVSRGAQSRPQLPTIMNAMSAFQALVSSPSIPTASA